MAADEVRLAEVVAALSLAVDIGIGAPFESGLRVCLVASRFAQELGLAEEDRRRVYDLALLRHVGCTAGSHEFAALVGDEIGFRAGAATVDFGRPSQALPYIARHVRAANGTLRAAAILAAFVATGGRELREGGRAICEVAEMLAARLGLPPESQRDLRVIGERWDGKGFPGGARGEELTVPVRVVQIAEGAAVFAEAAPAVLRERAGSAYDPELAERFAARAPDLLAAGDATSCWDEALAAEPGPPRMLSGGALDEALHVMADFSDLKSPYTAGHSPGVAALAEAAARAAGLPAADVTVARRAGLVHDLGRVGVSSAVWGREGPLTRDDWEKVRLHPYYTERVLARPEPLRAAAAVASLHHERLDGSGYHRGASAATIGACARIVAAADVYRALTEPRPHRAALEPGAAAAALREEVRAGRLDADAVEAVLEAAGHRVRRRRELVAGLTRREVEVLRLVARGLSMEAIARELSIARKTVDAHIQHIYAKIGVSTRAAAALFAMQHDLVDPLER